MKRVKKLFEPIKIGSMEVKNRIAFAPTTMMTCNDDGSVNDQLICQYVARAKGGVGLVIVESTLPTCKYATAAEPLLGCYKDRHIRGLKELADAVHASGAKAVVQLCEFGSHGSTLGGLKDLVAASPVPFSVPAGSTWKLEVVEGLIGETPRALTTEEVVELEDDFVAGAERIKRAGFDGIELHGAHGHLLAQFMSSRTNIRRDIYGGSLQGRLTLPLNIIRKSREKLGKDFVIGFRLSNEYTEGGLTLEDLVIIAPVLEAAGLDFIHVGGGCFEALKWMEPGKEGRLLPDAKAIKEVVKCPVICPNIHNPLTGQKVLEEESTDMISLSRGLIADPEWPNKAMEGKLDEINRCIFCNSCFIALLNQVKVSCAVNPNVGWERFMPEYYPTPLRAKRRTGGKKG